MASTYNPCPPGYTLVATTHNVYGNGTTTSYECEGVTPGAGGTGSGQAGGSGPGYCDTPGNPATGQSNCGGSSHCITTSSGKTFCPSPSPSPMPNCVATGAGGSTSYAGPRNAGGGNTTVNAIISNSAPLQNLSVDVSNVGTSPSIMLNNTVEPAAGSLANGTYEPASYDPNSHEIGWNTGLVDYDVDYQNGDAAEIAFHEYDHAWYDDTAVNSNQFNPIMSATLGGATYNWTIYTVAQNGDITFNSKGYDGYQHMMIHDDIVAAYGSDKTGALEEALSEADNAPGSPATVAAANSSSRPSFPVGSSTQKSRPTAATTTGSQACRAAAVRTAQFGSGVDFTPFLSIQQ